MPSTDIFTRLPLSSYKYFERIPDSVSLVATLICVLAQLFISYNNKDLLRKFIPIYIATVLKWSPVNRSQHRNKLWYIFVENAITIMRFVPEIQFGAGNAGTE